jgi:hypothetical protein
MSARNYLSRIALLGLVLAAAVPVIDQPPALAAEQIDITVEIEGACGGNESEVYYSPVLSTGIDFPMSAGDGFAQTAYIDFDIEPGQDAECEELHGYVTFVESGFDGPSIDTTFDCDESPIGAVGGFFTCEDFNGGSPDSIGIIVEALAGAEIGTYTNTITMTLVPAGP